MNATIMFKCGKCDGKTPGVFSIPAILETTITETSLNCTCVHCGSGVNRKFPDGKALFNAIELAKDETTIESTGGGDTLSVEKGGWFIGDDCIESATLYDSDENERGSVAKMVEISWRCEYRAEDGSLTTGERFTLKEAMQFLLDYGKELLNAGGFIDAFASFQMFPPQGERDGVTV